MTAQEIDWGVPIETILGPAGEPAARYARDLRDGTPIAELLPGRVEASADVVDLLLTRLPGWQVAAEPDLGRLLLARGAVTMRHAHTMAMDTSRAHDSWRQADPGPDLTVVPLDTDTLEPMSLLPSQQAAYPPGHPDHDEDVGSLIGLLVLIMGGDILGPLLPESSLVVTHTGEVVAGLIINRREGESPAGGAWVSDVWRHPDHRGLGTVLLQRALVSMRDRGERWLTLTVSEGNPARERYERLGFEVAMEALRVRLPDGPVRADAATARAFYVESARLRAHTLVPLVDGAFGVRDPRFHESYEHNRVISAGGVAAHDLARAADELLADCPHREIEVFDAVAAEDITALVAAGYEHQSLALMAREVRDDDGDGEPDPRVREVDEATVAPFVLEQWYRDMPAYGEATLRQLTDRRELLDVGSSVTRFAAEHDGVVVGSLDLVARGPVAELDALGVHPDHRGSGLGLSLMRAALSRAHRLGVRVTILSALRDDWPREWYGRLGFAEVSEVHEFTRMVGGA